MMQKPIFRPVREGGHLYERIVAQIEQLVDSAHLKPGDRLPPERLLAQQLGVSRPSLREAVKTLEARGRLSVKHGQGVFINTPISAEESLKAALALKEFDIRELFAMREVLEVPAAGWAAEEASAGDLVRIGTALKELDLATQREPLDYEELRRLDVEFHSRIAQAAGNRFLRRTMDVLHDMLAAGMQTTLQVPGRLAASSDDHQRILRALAASNPDAARRAMRSHLRAAEEAALARLQQERRERPGEEPRPEERST